MSVCRVLFGSDHLRSVCKISDFKIFKRLLLPQFSFSFNQTESRCMYSGEIKAVNFSGYLATNRFHAHGNSSKVYREVLSKFVNQIVRFDVFGFLTYFIIQWLCRSDCVVRLPFDASLLLNLSMKLY